MAFTLVSGTTTTSPSDNGSAGGTSASIILSGFGGSVGDLIVVVAQFKGNSTLSISNNGGVLNWNSLTQVANGTSSIGRIFWAQTPSNWASASATEQYTVSVASGTTALTVSQMYFRPTVSTNIISVDVAQVASSYVAPSTPFTVSITGVTTTSSSTVTLAVWMSEDDNTWGTLAGTGWSKTGLAAQVRNLQGTDQSLSHAYNIQTSPATLANVSQDQTANGGDPGIKFIVSWGEAAAPAITVKAFSLLGVG